MSYSELLALLGHRFTRPKMRELCRTLGAIEVIEGPELAVLVVREADGLPGRGWWIGGLSQRERWTGPAARAYVESLQALAFDHWASGEPTCRSRPIPTALTMADVV